MFEDLFQAALQNGIWTALFVTLFVWVLKENNKREQRLIGVVEKQSEALTAANETKMCIVELRKDMDDSHKRQETLLGRLLDRPAVKGD